MLRLLGGAGQSSSDSQGAPAVHPENRAAEAEKATSHSDRARQTPELLGPGKGTKRSPNRICASEGYLSTEPERLRPGKCTQPRAGLRQFPAEHRKAGAVCTPRDGTGPVGLRHCVHTTALFVCSIPPPHSATVLVSLKNQHKEEVKQKEPSWK